MAFLSRLYGKQVNKATRLAANKAAGATLTFDSYKDFPTYDQLQEVYSDSGCLLTGKGGEGDLVQTDDYDNGTPEHFNYRDSSTRNLYVDASANMIYRWKIYTKDQWAEDHWEWDDVHKTWIEPAKPGEEPKREDFATDAEYEEKHDEWQDLKDAQYPEATGGGQYVPCAGGGGGDLYWTEI